MKFWTPAGIARLEEEVREAQNRLRRATDDHATEVHTTSGSDSGIIERVGHHAGITVLQDQLRKKLDLRRTLRPATQPTNHRQVQVGHQVTIEYLDDSTRKKMGDVEKLILGGPGESDTNSNTISQSGPFGRALYDQPADAVVEIEADSGTFEVRIVAINHPVSLSVAQAA